VVVAELQNAVMARKDLVELVAVELVAEAQQQQQAVQLTPVVVVVEITTLHLVLQVAQE
jgi:hypothetical protein